jgi:hypothetical protein
MLPVLVWSLTTMLGVLLFAAFVRRPRRRADAIPEGPHGGAAAIVADSLGTAHVRPVVGGAGIPADEANLPRWLRPALNDQRQANDRGSLPAFHEPERFAAPGKGGAERRTIAYRLVRLSAGPDDIRFAEVGRLDRGDEVEVIGESDGFLKVRTPAGLEGWVPRVVIVG